MIIFFRGDRLAEKLRTNSVPEFDKFLYLLIPLAVVQLVPSNSLMTRESWTGLLRAPSLELLTPVLLSFAIVVAKLILFWWINQKGDGRDFITRYICLSFPAGVITNLLTFVIGLTGPMFLNFVLKLQGDSMRTAYSYFYTASLIFGTLVTCALTSYWMRQASREIR